MKALFSRLRYAFAVFAGRPAVPTSNFLTTETGAPITTETGEAITIS